MKCFLLLLFAFSAVAADAQIRKGIFPSIGIVYQRELMADMSIIRMSDDIQNMFNPNFRGTGLHGASDIRVGVETNFNPAHLIIAPKIGAEQSIGRITVRGSIADYWTTGSGTHDLRLTPEIGIGYFGIGALTLGYNIHLLGERNWHISGAKVSLLLNLNRKLLNDLRRPSTFGSK